MAVPEADAGARRRAIIATLVSTLLVTAYAFSYTFAQATPQPHEVEVALVGGDVAQVESAAGDSFAVRRAKDEQAARRLVADREVAAALVVSPTRPELLTAPAAGRATAEAVEQALPPAAGVTKAPQVVQVRPLVGEDPQGRAFDFQVFPLVIFGIVGPLLMTVLAPALTVRRRLAGVVAFAVLGGVASVLVTNVWLDSVPGPFAPLAATAALLLLAVAACVTALIAAVGPPGIVAGVLVFLIVGNVASGASTGRELLPAFYRAVGGWLPPGAGADALRSLAYFDGDAVARPLLVLASFALGGLVLDLVLGGRRPAAQGDPSGPTADATG